MAIMTEKQRSIKDQQEFDNLLKNLNISDRESKIEAVKMKVLDTRKKKRHRKR